jgi:hypothetical protein
MEINEISEKSHQIHSKSSFQEVQNGPRVFVAFQDISRSDCNLRLVCPAVNVSLGQSRLLPWPIRPWTGDKITITIICKTQFAIDPAALYPGSIRTTIRTISDSGPTAQKPVALCRCPALPGQDRLLIDRYYDSKVRT